MNETFFDSYISGISFQVLDPKLIQKIATVKVVTPELYDKEGYPVDGGLMDLRMGVVDPGLRCRTCGGRMKQCPGHFGYIPLARPVLHVLFINQVYHILQSTCKSCGRALIDEKEIKQYGEDLKIAEMNKGVEGRIETISKIIKNTKKIQTCPYCGTKQDKITLEKPYAFLENNKRMNLVQIRARLEKIPDSDLYLFGLNPKAARPEWLILTELPVPPVTVRPSIILESGEKSEDDLTHKLSDIVRINQRLFENINAGAPEIIVEDLWDLLQYHVATLFNNNLPQLPVARQRSGTPLKTLVDRISSKEGRIRYNLLGKRTNFSSRSVISPDPMINPEEIGVPYFVAMKLTVPEKVTKWNMNYLKKFVEKGTKKYPGANYIIRPDGKKKKITEETKEALIEEIQPGYVIERHLMDGDIVLFNRHPSLHKMSLMAHKVRVLDGLTFRLNPSVCTPYNADFDGDEMNIHVLQIEEARAEAEILMSISTQMISPRYGLSIIGAIQDGVLGNYILTKYKTEIPRKDAIDLLFSAGVLDVSKLPKKDKVSGKEIFSVILPDTLNYVGKTRDKEEPVLVIENGWIKKGVMDKANLGEGAGLLLREINRSYGADFALQLMGTIMRLGIAVVMKYGFSLYLTDSELSKENKQKIDEIIQHAKKEVDELINTFREGKLESYPGRTVEETLESMIIEKLNSARTEAERLLRNSSDPKVPTIILAKSGARGSLLNLTQISSFVGQQALRGKRIERGYSNRPLSCFEKGDLSPESRGFIKRGFKQGLKPYEFYYASMTGRDSLMDTALRTPKSGYLYRRISTALHDVIVKQDETVRTDSNEIIQFKYGDDGIDVSKSMGGKLDVDNIIRKVLGDSK